MALPNFLCVGAAKSGTTSLHGILTHHPDIFLPAAKECHFFDYEENFAKGITWYEKEFFKDHRSQKATGEITPSYMYLERVPERLRSALGDSLKIIFMLRHPVDRAYSHYLMMQRRGREDRVFREAIRLESSRISQSQTDRLRFSYMSRGRYAEQILRYLELFPMESMFFLIFEDEFLKNRGENLTRLQQFLGVTPVDLPNGKRKNPASQPRSRLINRLVYSPPAGLRRLATRVLPSVSSRARTKRLLGRLNQRAASQEPLDLGLRKQLLEEFFDDDVRRLEGILGRRLDVWYR